MLEKIGELLRYALNRHSPSALTSGIRIQGDTFAPAPPVRIRPLADTTLVCFLTETLAARNSPRRSRSGPSGLLPWTSSLSASSASTTFSGQAVLSLLEQAVALAPKPSNRIGAYRGARGPGAPDRKEFPSPCVLLTRMRPRLRQPPLRLTDLRNAQNAANTFFVPPLRKARLFHFFFLRLRRSAFKAVSPRSYAVMTKAESGCGSGT